MNFATGTTPAEPTCWVRWIRGFELLAWGVAAPVTVAWVRSGRAVLPWLWLATIGLWVFLMRDPQFDRRVWAWGRVNDGRWPMRLVRWAIACACLAGGLAWWEPATLWWLPRHRPGVWLFMLIFYTLASVVPQTIVYRVFFFHRYQSLFSSPALAMHAAAAVFASAHVVFLNPWAVLLSWAAGYVFVWTYIQTRSAWAVTLEHVLYGWAILTIGWGRWFDDGTIRTLDAWMRT